MLYLAINLLIALILAAVVAAICYKYSAKRQVVGAIALMSFVIILGVTHFVLTPVYQTWVLKVHVNKIPIMPAIRKNHPAEYQQLIEQAKVSVKEDMPAGNFIAYAFFYANGLFLQDLRSAPSPAIYDYLYNLKLFYDMLYQHNPAFVIKFEEGDLSVLNDIAPLLQEGEFKASLDKGIAAKINLINAANETPVLPPIPEVVDPLMASLGKILSDKYGQDVVQIVFLHQPGEVNPEIKAKVILDFYREVLNLDKEKAGAVMRHIGNSAVKQQQLPHQQQAS